MSEGSSGARTSVLLLHPLAAQLAAALEPRFAQVKFISAQPEQPLPAGALAVDAIVTMSRYLSDDSIAQFTRLRWIQALTSGVDGFSALRNLPQQVAITSVRGIHGPAVSEHVLLHMLALSRNFVALQEQQRQQVWQRGPQPLLHGKTVVVVGTGVIACALATRCRALGMRTVGVSTQVRDIAEFDVVLSRQQLAQAAGQADFLVIVLPLDDSTLGLVNADVFNAMRAGSYFINVSRGGVCDEDALLQALQSGHLGGAALDVFATEPLPPQHPLWTAPRTLITPHIAGESDSYVDQVLPIIEANLACFVRGDVPGMVNLVRPRPAAAAS